MSQTLIRMVEERDVPQILDIYAPFIKHTAVSFEEEVPSVQEFWERIQSYLQEAPWLVYETEGRIGAYAYASPHRGRAAYRWNRELSAYVAEDFQRKGIARALYHSILKIIKAQGYLNALAGITMPNDPSVAFHEAMGFSKVGIYHNVGYKFGKITDTGWWEMRIQDDEFQPDEIRLTEKLDPELMQEAFREGLAMIRR